VAVVVTLPKGTCEGDAFILQDLANTDSDRQTALNYICQMTGVVDPMTLLV
jgi:hypothetical protein